MEDRKSLIADTMHGSIALSKFEKDIMNTTLFNRLHDIYQNSTAYLTFPANRTKRMEHSFGCMYLCGNIFYSSLCNAEKDILQDFLQKAEKEMEQIIKEISERKGGHQYEIKLGGVFKKIKSKYNDLAVSGGIYNYYIPGNIRIDKDRKIYAILFEGIRIAALLHDIGHPPYSHISENALNILYNDIYRKAEMNVKEKEFCYVLEGMVGESHQLHEEMGLKIAEILLMDAIENILADDTVADSIYENQVYRILVKETAIRILKEQNLFFKDLHGVIDGTLDGDRLDYVSRDPENSGLRLGHTEYDRLIYKLKLCKEGEHFLFCPDVSAVKIVDDFLMRRWNLYKNIIFHHRVVKTDYLLQSVIVQIARDYFGEDSEDEKEESYILPYNISGLWKANRPLPSDKESAYALSQWNDAWLLTVLKKSYFERYIDDTGYLHDQLEELLTNRKNYNSLIKRQEDFQEIDEEVATIINERKAELLEALELLRNQAEDINYDEGKIFDIKGYLQGVSEIIEASEMKPGCGLPDRDGFILRKIKRNIFEVEHLDIVFNKMMEKTGYKTGELLCAEKQPSTGIKKDLFFYKILPDRSEKHVPLNHISNINDILLRDLNLSPVFYIYINRKAIKHRKFSDIRSEIGEAMGTCIVDYILETINQFIN